MKALRYLMATRLKNKLKLLAKSPGQLIFVLLILALLAFTVFAGGQTEQAGQYRPISEVYAMVFLLNAFVFLQTAHNGFSNGASLYTMQDVNLVSPPLSLYSACFFMALCARWALLCCWVSSFCFSTAGSPRAMELILAF